MHGVQTTCGHGNITSTAASRLALTTAHAHTHTGVRVLGAMPLTAQHAGGVHRRRLCKLACAARRARGVRLPIRGVRIVLAALGLVVELDVRVAAALAVLVRRVCARQKKKRAGRRAVGVDVCRCMVGRVRVGARRRARCVVVPHESEERHGAGDAPSCSSVSASWASSIVVDGRRRRRRANRR